MRVSRYLLSLFLVGAGTLHFVIPGFYLKLMPPYLPWHRELVMFSGLAEIAGGIGILIPATRRPAAWGLIVLLFAVLPANLEMALHGFGGLPQWVLWLRLPFQLVFVAWIYWACLEGRSDGN